MEENYKLSHLRELEAESIHIIREVAAEFENPVMPDRASEIICPVLPPRIPRTRLVLPSAATTLETLMRCV